MTLQPCAECRRAVSTRAHACPHCGAPPPGVAMVPASAAQAALSADTQHVAGPSEGFWSVARVVLRRLRIGCYGLGSAIFAGVLTGSVVLDLTGWALGTGLLSAVVLCLLGLMFEILETSLGKGEPDED